MFPLLRAAFTGLLISLAVVHTVEFFGPLQLFWLDGNSLERAERVSETLIAYRFTMVASVFVALSALMVPPGFFIGRGHNPKATSDLIAGSSLFVSLAAALLASALLAQVMTLYKAMLPLVSAAVKSSDLSFFGGESGSLPVSIEQALLSVGRGAVFQEFNRYEALFTRQSLVYLPIAEALFGMASLVFFSRLRPGRALELFFLGGALFLMAGAGLALYLLEGPAASPAGISVSIGASRLGFILLAGGLILGLDGLRRLAPDGTLR